MYSSHCNVGFGHCRLTFYACIEDVEGAEDLRYDDLSSVQGKHIHLLPPMVSDLVNSLTGK